MPHDNRLAFWYAFHRPARRCKLPIVTRRPGVAVNESIGKVWLIGAGPGDPGLLTVKGAALLARADVVVYDYLANPRLLAHCPAAEKIYVGKKAAAHAFTQDQINALLIEHARAG